MATGMRSWSLEQAAPAPFWVLEAACRSVDPEIFFDKGQMAKNSPGLRLSKENEDNRNRAKAICATCPVMLKCREHFMNEEHGVYGGLDRDQRRHLRAGTAHLRRTNMDRDLMGQEAFDLSISGQSLAPLAKQYGMRTAQLVQLMEHYLSTPAGLRLQLERRIRALDASGSTEEEMAFELGIPLVKVSYIRRKLGLVKRLVSQRPARLSGIGHDCSVLVGRETMPGHYLGESADDPPFYFVQIRGPQASTRKWVRSEDVILEPSVRRHVISKGVDSGKKRDGDTERSA